MLTIIIATLCVLAAIGVGILVLVVWSVGVDASRARGNWPK